MRGRAKSLENSNSPEVTRILQAYKNGMGAGSIVEDIHQKAQAYLARVDSNSEYKDIENWIAYGDQLGASSYYMDNLRADMYYKRGKVKKAINYKKQALANWPDYDKKRDTRVYELSLMEGTQKIK